MYLRSIPVVRSPLLAVGSRFVSDLKGLDLCAQQEPDLGMQVQGAKTQGSRPIVSSFRSIRHHTPNHAAYYIPAACRDAQCDIYLAASKVHLTHQTRSRSISATIDDSENDFHLAIGTDSDRQHLLRHFHSLISYTMTMNTEPNENKAFSN